tara:strand:+ start:245 stop:1177 length:933 start_codon:yes stop_codon:yes gene_type:complete
MNMPLVTVVIPVFNGEKYVGECIDGVLGQSYKEIEVIVVNDGSTDGTAKILESYEDRIQVLEQVNSGQARARNRAMSISNGELIAFLDCDDLWDPEKIQKQVALHNRFPEAVASYCDHRIIDGDGVVLNTTGALYRPRWSGEILASLIQANCIIAPSVVLAKKKTVVEAGGFDETQPAGSDDWQLWMHLAEAGPFLYLLDTLVGYRRHDQNMSSSWGYKKALGNLHALHSVGEKVAKRRQERLGYHYKNALCRTNISVGWQLRQIGERRKAIHHYLCAFANNPYRVDLLIKSFLILISPTAILKSAGANR